MRVDRDYVYHLDVTLDVIHMLPDDIRCPHVVRCEIGDSSA